MKTFNLFMEILASVSLIAFFAFIVAAIVCGNSPTLFICGGISMGIMVVSGGIYSAIQPRHRPEHVYKLFVANAADGGYKPVKMQSSKMNINF